MTVGIFAAAVALGGCKTQPLGPVVPTGGLHPPAGSGGTNGGGATNGRGGAPSGGGGLGVGGAAGFGSGSGVGGLGAGSGMGGDGVGAGGTVGTGSGGSFVTGSGGGGSVTGSGGSGGSGQCEGVGHLVTATPPEFLIVMSRAMELGSYLDSACIVPECVKWTILESAVQTVVAANRADNYGLMMFGADTTCDAPQYPDLDISPQSWMQVISDLGVVNLGGPSPMAGTITSAVTYLQSLTDASPKYILLVTDGEATCAPGDANGTVDDSARAEGEISAAYYAGFPTLVLGVADPNNAQEIANLNTMANAGAMPQVGADTAYYQAGSSAGITALEQAIAALVGPGPGCTFSAPSGGPPCAALSVTLAQGASRTPVPYDPTGTSGWNYTDSTATVVSLDGSYCSQLGAAAQTIVELTWDCGPDGLPIP